VKTWVGPGQEAKRNEIKLGVGERMLVNSSMILCEKWANQGFDSAKLGVGPEGKADVDMALSCFHDVEAKAVGKGLLVGPLIENDRRSRMIDEQGVAELLIPDGADVE
jgi:hypothetical protein